MRKTTFGFVVILVTMIAFSCKSTGDTSVVDATPPAPAPAPRPEPERVLEQIYNQYETKIILTGAKEYTVVKGDTLSKIARDNYGPAPNAYCFPLIIAASKESANIFDPDEIEVGMKLIIPDLQENLNDAKARDNLKNLIWDVADFYSGKNGPQSAKLHDGLVKLHDTL
ncbi:MAG: LysM peptidoglycan-binding domain-containing protein [Treponema sp.]|jgi:LysM repeat protein|nr:LysM peptidoglycan-binding domain-containing protein [Treponema sp.]